MTENGQLHLMRRGRAFIPRSEIPRAVSSTTIQRRVEGLRSKPIIDILVGVAPLEDWVRCKRPLEELGYDYAENAGVPGHFIFGRGRDRTERTHLIHVVEFNGESWQSNLAFRDALRADQSLRTEYLRTKEQAVAFAPEGRGRYNDLKHSFFEQIVRSRGGERP